MLRFFKDLEVFMILEEKIYFFNNFFSNEIVWTGEVWISTVDAYSEMEFCMPIWLNHDHGDGGFVDIPPIFLIQKLFSKNSKLKWTHHLTKLNTNKSYYVDNI
jgi:hypothetical protein